mmetsp:Transcript_58753/g.70700  ORF Transcript_58753/g.70700 Transcript_58753/m.70700 type:complete len:455 (-) Transcript_58753:324-1688(-)
MNADQNNNLKSCFRCNVSLGKGSFSCRQWKGFIGKARCCKSCIESGGKGEERCCQRCKQLLNKVSFSKIQWKGDQKILRTCKACLKNETTKSRKRTVNEMENDANLVNSKQNQSETGDNQSKPMAPAGKVKAKKKQTIAIDPFVIKRKLIERPTILPKNQEPKSFRLQWKSTPVCEEDERNIAAQVVVKGRYGPFNKQEKEKISNYIRNKPSAMTFDQARSLRSVLLQQKAMYRYDHLQRNAKILYEKYMAGESIVSLSEFVDCPPMNVFRTILAMMNYSKGKIKRCLRDPKKELNKREQREFSEAEGADSVSNANQDSLRDFADAFEDIIAVFLKQKGISFVRQCQLEIEQKKIFGKVVLTPDFLLLDEVEINGQRVTWLDAKAYYGANIRFSVKKMKKQMSRYINHWGGGAIMFLQGFSENLVMDGCTMLYAGDVMSASDLLSLNSFEKLRV